MLAVCQEQEMAPCLKDGNQIAAAGRGFTEQAKNLGDSRAASVLRAWCVAHVFAETESIFASGVEPLSAFADMMRHTSEVLRRLHETGISSLGSSSLMENEGDTEVETITGEHYGQLFRNFAPESYMDETRNLLRTRLERNGIDLATLRGKSFLDAGCGGGRYTVAAKLLGVGSAVGLDISPVNVSTGTDRAREAGVGDIRFEVGDVLRLPYEKNSFEIVFSNGVLHHTRNWRQGIAELVRVLRPGGLGWLYLIESPGGLFWDSIEILRVVMRDESRAMARLALQMLGIPANRIFYMLDHVMAPINIRLTPAEVEQALWDSGASGIRRLDRGTDFDRIERLYGGEPFAPEKFGVGENRYVFTKE